jgi:acyl-CoA thioester hydrolase
MASRFTITRQVEFADTDMAGIMHFANFFRFMESAEHAFFRSLGLSVHCEIDGRTITWPRVEASCQFTRPLRFEDTVEIEVLVREKRDKSITCEHVFRKREAGGGVEEVARGRMTLVCVALGEEGRPMKAVPIPASIAALIEVAPA